MHFLFILFLMGLGAGAWAETMSQPETPRTVAEETRLQRFWKQDYLSGDWGGTRSQWEARGLVFTADYRGEVLANVAGGIKKGAIYEGVLNLGVDLDLEKLTTWWKGGTFHANAFWIEGPSLSQKYTGDFLAVSNIDAYDTVRLFELWYEQSFFDHKLNVRVGQLAADSEFAISEYSGLFLNGTFGWPGGIAANAATPAYAVATPGFRLRVDPLPQVYFQAAVFDGGPDSFQTDGSPMNNSGTRVNFNEEEGLFSIYELGYKLHQEEKASGLPGTYKIGGWWHSDVMADPCLDSANTALAFSVTGEAKAHDGNWGIYGIIDQMVWREAKQDGDQGLGLFYRVMGSPGNRSALEFYTDGGLNYKGLIPGRDNDLFGVGVAYGQVGNGICKAQCDLNLANTLTSFASGPNPRVPHDEMVMEATYQILLTPWCYLQPDFQYIVHPGGSSQWSNAVVIGMRTGLVF